MRAVAVLIEIRKDGEREYYLAFSFRAKREGKDMVTMHVSFLVFWTPFPVHCPR